MRTGRPFRWPPRLPGVKRGEETPAVLLFLLFFLITAPFSIFKSIRDASFLTELGSENLPLAYATAFFVGLAVALQAKLQARVSRRALLSGSMMFFSLTGAIFALLLQMSGKWLALAYWVWANILIVSLMTQYWMLVNDIFNPREAKRLIGFIGSGGILGGIAGGLLTGFLAESFPLGILFLGGVLLLAAIPVILRLTGRGRPGGEPRDSRAAETENRDASLRQEGFKSCFDIVRRNDYLRLLAGIVLLTGLISTFVDWQSKAVIEMTVRGHLASFFGWFNAGLLIFSFFLQILGTSRIVDRYGIRSLLLFYPAVILIFTLGLSAWPVLVLAVALKGGDKSLSYSINQSARELLYFPVPPEQRVRAKVFIDMFLNRFSRTAGAILLLAAFALPWPSPLQAVGILSVLTLAAWIALNLKAASAYVRIVKDKLRGRWDRGDRVVEAEVDVGFAKTVFDLIETRRRSPVLFSLHLYDLMRKKKLTPDIRAMLLSEPGDPRFTALGALFEAGAEAAASAAGLEAEDAALEQFVREVMGLEVYGQVMEEYLARALERGGADDPVTRMEIAKALGLMPPRSPLVRRLEELLEDESEDVVRYALESAGRLGLREHVPAVVRRLGHPRLQDAAEEALMQYGPRITGGLLDILLDSSEPPAARRKAASILGGIGDQDAVDGLLFSLGAVSGKIRDEVLDALDRARSAGGVIRFDRNLVLAHLAEEFKRVYKIFIAEARTRKEGKDDPMRKGWASGLVLGVFKILGLAYPREDVFKAYKNWLSGTRESVAYALELLDNFLSKSVRDRLFPLLEDHSLKDRLRLIRSRLKNGGELRP
ncbi:MAG: MFS transporter [Candidatus Aminicenantes bacterium]|nr:MFS transporter [Candidatus Aminicenantes bacterium]